jgi:hypothetical protein
MSIHCGVYGCSILTSKIVFAPVNKAFTECGETIKETTDMID